MNRAFGLKIEIAGTPVKDRQTLFVANHVSYFDILALGSLLRASFVAKADVARWPLFGLLARECQTIFIDRKRAAAAHGKNLLADALASGKSLIVFPEGTSTDGAAVLPFKSTLFAAAADAPDLMVQPVTIELVSTATGQRDLYAWHGDMTLAPHLWAFAKNGGAHVRVHFHAPHAAAAFADRKALARLCHEAVAGPLQTKLANAA
jgi:1-acyl-sn-glycerol-3-phosphate acyltransferase